MAKQLPDQLDFRRAQGRASRKAILRDRATRRSAVPVILDAEDRQDIAKRCGVDYDYEYHYPDPKMQPEAGNVMPFHDPPGSLTNRKP